MKELVGLHGPLAVNVDATMWHDYLGEWYSCRCTCVRKVDEESHTLGWSSVICNVHTALTISS